MLRKIKMNKNSHGLRGQTALEYALVVAAISLVIMAAWNIVGEQVQNAIKGEMLGRITDHLTKGNATIKR